MKEDSLPAAVGQVLSTLERCIVTEEWNDAGLCSRHPISALAYIRKLSVTSNDQVTEINNTVAESDPTSGISSRIRSSWSNFQVRSSELTVSSGMAA